MLGPVIYIMKYSVNSPWESLFCRFFTKKMTRMSGIPQCKSMAGAEVKIMQQLTSFLCNLSSLDMFVYMHT